MNYFIRTFGIWKNNISTNFHKIFMKKYWKLSSWELVFGNPWEKSILVVSRITRDNFIRNQKIEYFLLEGEYESRKNSLRKNGPRKNSLRKNGPREKWSPQNWFPGK